MSLIEDVIGREILDSRGNPTVEVEVELLSGARGRAAVPSGASTGAYEAVELRDGGDRYVGKGVRDAVANVNGEIRDAVIGSDGSDQRGLDADLVALDGTPSKSRLGANAILGVSLAAAKAVAEESGFPLYRYVGGANAHVLPGPADERVERRRARGLERRRAGVHARAARCGQLLRGVALGRRDVSRVEGVAPGARSQHRARRRGRLRTEPPVERGSAASAARKRSTAPATARARRSRSPSTSPRPSSSPTASTTSPAKGRKFTAPEFVDYLADLCDRYPIVSIEDGMAEDDWDGWRALTERLGEQVQLVGDDVFVTNSERLREGIERGVANSVLVKVNQIGTLTETLDTVDLAGRAAYTSVMSHRSGETEDATIADLAVATNCGQIKTGAPARSDRVAKYNQLLRIEEALGDGAEYLGRRRVRGGR